MNVLEKIVGQVSAVRLPLFAVTLTALPRADTPVLLMLHWHGFRPDETCRTNVGIPRVPVPGSVLQINEGWGGLRELDQLMLEAAWQLGAWELDREVRRGCNAAGASEGEILECQQAFGRHPGMAVCDIVADAPDCEDLVRLGAETGYVRWQFRPVRSGVWLDTARDDSLGPGGGREPPCPVMAQDAQVGARVRYRLGRVDRIFLP